MKKPNNYETTQAYGDFTPLELGGHICKIMKVEETKSKAGNDMIIISLDIAEGDQKDYFSKQYKADTRENKKWGCIVYQLVEDKDGNTHKGFKTFIKSVEKSNKGFDSDSIWNDDFAGYFKNKLVGGVFGREQYINQNGELKWSTKCVQFRDVETIRKGVEVPEDKYLPGNNNNANNNSSVNVLDDGDLPF